MSNAARRAIHSSWVSNRLSSTRRMGEACHDGTNTATAFQTVVLGSPRVSSIKDHPHQAPLSCSCPGTGVDTSALVKRDQRLLGLMGAPVSSSAGGSRN